MSHFPPGHALVVRLSSHPSIFSEQLPSWADVGEVVLPLWDAAAPLLCPVCLESLVGRAPVMTRCGHGHCAACLAMCVPEAVVNTTLGTRGAAQSSLLPCPVCSSWVDLFEAKPITFMSPRCPSPLASVVHSLAVPLADAAEKTFVRLESDSGSLRRPRGGDATRRSHHQADSAANDAAPRCFAPRHEGTVLRAAFRLVGLPVSADVRASATKPPSELVPVAVTALALTDATGIAPDVGADAAPYSRIRTGSHAHFAHVWTRHAAELERAAAAAAVEQDEEVAAANAVVSVALHRSSNTSRQASRAPLSAGGSTADARSRQQPSGKWGDRFSTASLVRALNPSASLPSSVLPVFEPRTLQGTSSAGASVGTLTVGPGTGVPWSWLSPAQVDAVNRHGELAIVAARRKVAIDVLHSAATRMVVTERREAATPERCRDAPGHVATRPLLSIHYQSVFGDAAFLHPLCEAALQRAVAEAANETLTASQKARHEASTSAVAAGGGVEQSTSTQIPPASEAVAGNASQPTWDVATMGLPDLIVAPVVERRHPILQMLHVGSPFTWAIVDLDGAIAYATSSSHVLSESSQCVIRSDGAGLKLAPLARSACSGPANVDFGNASLTRRTGHAQLALQSSTTCVGDELARRAYRRRAALDKIVHENATALPVRHSQRQYRNLHRSHPNGADIRLAVAAVSAKPLASVGRHRKSRNERGDALSHDGMGPADCRVLSSVAMAPETADVVGAAQTPAVNATAGAAASGDTAAGPIPSAKLNPTASAFSPVRVHETSTASSIASQPQLDQPKASTALSKSGLPARARSLAGSRESAFLSIMGFAPDDGNGAYWSHDHNDGGVAAPSFDDTVAFPSLGSPALSATTDLPISPLQRPLDHGRAPPARGPLPDLNPPPSSPPFGVSAAAATAVSLPAPRQASGGTDSGVQYARRAAMATAPGARAPTMAKLTAEFGHFPPLAPPKASR